ncbi:sulfatase [Luteolibacter algae]|uniref:Sulfatase n=1 Tax=Luteolibacter algae TaxID=454151 RepID=A0ABW5D6F0_9BACT
MKILHLKISLLLTAILPWQLLSANETTDPVDKPNILVIIADDLGWADIGYNNPEKVYSPNSDRLASEGATFENHYVMPQCTPTRVALMTGRYPGRFGKAALKATNERCFPVGTPTIATMLKQRGYETFLCGKWHLGAEPEDGPNHHGFDYSYGSLAGAVGMYDHRYRKGKYFETWHRNMEFIPGSENGRHATDLIQEDAVRIISQKHENPFLLALTFHAPHTPLDERGRFTDQPTRLDPDNPGRWLNEDEIEWFNDPKGIIQKEKDPEKRLFLAAVHHLDHAIGMIVQSLDERGLRENTLILFSSDNGPQHSWPGNAYPDDLKLTDFNQRIPMRGHKVDVWEGGIRVPGFANWKGKIKPGAVTDQVHIIDWFPTLAKISGNDPVDAGDLDGIDISPALLSGNTLEKRDLYWIWNPKINRWALRFGAWKIVSYGTKQPAVPGDWQLFNISEDPMESRNIAEQNPEILSDLHSKFLKQRAKDNQQKSLN